MGQAKRRGSLNDRIQQAQLEQEREEPINVPCKTCKEPLNGFTLMKHTPSGAIWQKKCECGAITTAVVQARYSTLPRSFGSSLSVANEMVGPDRKVSVSFYEKSIETVETGLIPLGKWQGNT